MSWFPLWGRAKRLNALQRKLDRLQAFQAGPFKCRENAIAITKIEEAMLWLGKRTADRARRGVLGTDKV